ncbi:hypothetical protein O181_103637 [Austropuccinia psidii MF-1]|uniref:CCHC-type domain-containing protein n=1 Tax=Austropuccinia psidii MF-1 TaxID=1389203 RepID=A0A9Q3JK49_9BASI|nr:hypothetical protein [Austropuccinia psidii MF-1]
MSQFRERTQKQFAELQASHEGIKKLTASIERVVKPLQEGHAQLGKASEETNRRLNKVFEEQKNSKRKRDCLDQDIKKLFNVYHNMKPQPKGYVKDNPYHQEKIKPDGILDISYSEKESLKHLPEASRWPKFFVTGEYDHMEPIYYIDGIFIDVPSITDYCITARLNTSFKGNASISIHRNKRYTWKKSQIFQRYRNGTWIWQKTRSFEKEKYSVDKDPYEQCLRQSKRLKAIDPQMNIYMRNEKLLKEIPGQLEHTEKCRCTHNYTLDEIENTLQDIRKRTNIAKYSPYKSSGFKHKQPFKVEFKEKPRERVAEVTKKKNTCQNCSSTDHYANNCPKANLRCAYETVDNITINQQYYDCSYEI